MSEPIQKIIFVDSDKDLVEAYSEYFSYLKLPIVGLTTPELVKDILLKWPSHFSVLISNYNFKKSNITGLELYNNFIETNPHGSFILHCNFAFDKQVLFPISQKTYFCEKEPKSLEFIVTLACFVFGIERQKL